MCITQLLLQFLDFLLVLLVGFLILCVDLRVLGMCFFQLIDSLVLFFDLLALFGDHVFQLVELLVVNSRRCPDRQDHNQRAAGGGAS